MKPTRSFLLTATCSFAFALTACAQVPPPAPPPPPPAVSTPAPPPPAATAVGTPATHNSLVRAVVYGPQGEVQGLALRSGVTVNVPPELAARLRGAIIRGTRVQVSGPQIVIAGQTSLNAQSIVANGQTYVAAPAPAQAAAPPPPPPPDPRGPRGLRGRAPAPQPPPPDGGTPPPPPPSDRAAVPPPPPPPDGAAPPPQM